MGKEAWPNLKTSNGTAGYTRGTHFLLSGYHGSKQEIKVVERLGLSFRSMKELNKKLDGASRAAHKAV